MEVNYLTFFRTVIDNIADGIVIMDPNKIIFYNNAAIEEITKFTFLDLIGLDFTAFRSPHTTDEMLEDIWINVNQYGSWKGELICAKADRSEWHAYISVSIIYDEENKHIGYVGIFRDITDLKTVQSKLDLSFTQLKKYESQLDSAKIESINILLRASMAKDDDTGQHLSRIRHYTYELTLIDNKSHEYAKQLSFSAILHDIGKLRIPDSILKKRAKLTDEEKIIMQKHAIYGFQILTESETFEMDRMIALCHHECWDGSGYPYGRFGEEIPYEARIVKIVDVFDALLSKRPYKEPWPRDKVFKYMENGRGTSFDPRLLSKFFELEDKGVLLSIERQFRD